MKHQRGGNGKRYFHINEVIQLTKKKYKIRIRCSVGIDDKKLYLRAASLLINQESFPLPILDGREMEKIQCQTSLFPKKKNQTS